VEVSGGYFQTKPITGLKEPNFLLNMKTDQEIQLIFDNIRRAQNDGVYAPHKPLLVLLALARIQQGLPRQVPFTEIDAPLRVLLAEFGPSSSAKSRHYPFWHLSTDGQGALWQIEGPENFLNRAPKDTPSLTELRNPLIKAGFSVEIDTALRKKPELLKSIASRVLNSYFPETLHADIASVVGLNLDQSMEIHGGDKEDLVVNSSTRRRRDPTFRDRVLRAYEFRCCVCGFDLRIGTVSAGLEAAHIQWHTVGGPDIEPNGLSLCALHHKLFDLGAFTVEPSEHRVVFSQHAIAGNRSLEGELRHHGQKMFNAQESAMYPGKIFLDWNQKNVFKKPGRKVDFIDHVL
jgi:putative restriction endonuclease